MKSPVSSWYAAKQTSEEGRQEWQLKRSDNNNKSEGNIWV